MEKTTVLLRHFVPALQHSLLQGSMLTFKLMGALLLNDWCHQMIHL